MSYQQGRSISELVSGGLLHPDCGRLFVFGEEKKPLVLYTHQQEAITYVNEHKNYVVTTGTGSGKSLTFIIPIINEVLRSREKAEPRRTRAVIIYPMNALANSQAQEFEKFLSNAEDLDIRVGGYTGQESQEERKKLADNPPDVLLTNYMMLEYLLTCSAAETDRRGKAFPRKFLNIPPLSPCGDALQLPRQGQAEKARLKQVRGHLW